MVDPRNVGLLGLQNLVNDVETLRPARANDYPIVLVPGFAGWGDALFGTFNYWGGFEDLPVALQNAGYTIIVVRIGPLSSNWERACEVFAQLRNIRNNAGFDTPGAPPTGTIAIDYGQQHLPPPYAQTRPNGNQAVVFGNLPHDWEWSAINKVHLICHSQGGTTIRKLIELMSGTHGNIHPTYFDNAPGAAPQNNQNWIKSVVTIGTPHKGTTITDIVENLLGPNLLSLLSRFIVSASFKPPPDRFYDLQLDHWGIRRQPGETSEQMYNRLLPIVRVWWTSRINGFYDNSITGINDLDIFAPQPSPDICYFTMSFDATVPFPDFQLTAEDLRTYPILNLNGLSAGVGNILLHLPFISPPILSWARWFVQVANNHLGTLGYFNRLPPPGDRVPRNDMLPLLAFFAYAMGGHDAAGANYQPNDGIVNTISMSGPTTGPIREYGFPAAAVGSPVLPVNVRGMYWHLGTNVTMDHADQIGVFTDRVTYLQVELMYELFGRLLSRLP